MKSYRVYFINKISNLTFSLVFNASCEKKLIQDLEDLISRKYEGHIIRNVVAL